MNLFRITVTHANTSTCDEPASFSSFLIFLPSMDCLWLVTIHKQMNV